MTIAGENQGQMHRVFWPVFDTDRLFVCFSVRSEWHGKDRAWSQATVSCDGGMEDTPKVQ